MNKFIALKLSEKINNIVLRESAKYKVDLNSVDLISSNCLQIGEVKTGLIILIRKEVIETFKGGDLVSSEPIKLNLPDRYKLENPTLSEALQND